MDRLDQEISRHLRAKDARAGQSAARVIAALTAKSLPAQRRSWLHWPSALLNTDFGPAWPRIAALACVALLGCTIGFFGPGTRAFQRTGWTIALAQNSDSDISGLVFEPEPLTGAKP
jgi:hypothetical protein